MGSSKQTKLRLLEASIVLGGLMFFAEKAVGAEALAPFPKRAWLVVALYCMAVAVYSYVRLFPHSRVDAFRTAIVLTCSQALWYLFMVFAKGYPTNQPDISHLQWFFMKLPFVAVPVLLGLLVLQLGMHFWRDRAK